MDHKKGFRADTFLTLAACQFVMAVIFFAGPYKFLGVMWICVGSYNLIIGLKKKKDK
ncbi:MAG: hypothetical protein IJO60_09585 [Agathobacter sp.]|nr:hypothetical protein [Agathobacter sp.]